MFPMRRVASILCYCCLVGAAIFIATAVASSPAVGATMSDTFAAWVAESIAQVPQLAGRTRGAVLRCVPAAAMPHLGPFLKGFTSMTLVGQGFRGIPGAAVAAAAAAPASGVADAVAVIMVQPVEKLFYSIGGIVAEIALLRLLVCPPRLPAFTVKEKMPHGFFYTHAGWLLLVACVAIPNGVVDVGFFIALFARLPLETYTPALVVGKLARPYVAAALCSVPFLTKFLQAPAWWTARMPSLELHTPVMELAMWTAIAATLMLLAARYLVSEPSTAVDKAVESIGNANEDEK